MIVTLHICSLSENKISRTKKKEEENWTHHPCSGLFVSIVLTHWHSDDDGGGGGGGGGVWHINGGGTIVAVVMVVLEVLPVDSDDQKFCT